MMDGSGSWRWIFLLAAVAGCTKPPASSAEVPVGAAVATVGARVLTRAEIENRIAKQPDFVRVRLQTPERKKEFVENLVRTELLVQAAKKRGLEDDPEVREVVERVLVQRLLQKELEAGPVPEEESRAWYAAHASEFVRPERVRVADFFFASPKGDPKRAAVKAEAAKELAALVAAKEEVRAAAFASAVRRRSNAEATKSVDGDLGPRTLEELTQTQGAPVAEAAFALKAVGALSGVVETEYGYHLLRLLGRQPGEETKFEVARPRIENRLQAERRGTGMEKLVEKLKAETKVEVSEVELAKIAVPAPAGPLVPAAGLQPVAIPGAPPTP